MWLYAHLLLSSWFFCRILCTRNSTLVVDPVDRMWCTLTLSCVGFVTCIFVCLFFVCCMYRSSLVHLFAVFLPAIPQAGAHLRTGRFLERVFSPYDKCSLVLWCAIAPAAEWTAEYRCLDYGQSAGNSLGQRDLTHTLVPSSANGKKFCVGNAE